MWAFPPAPYRDTVVMKLASPSLAQGGLFSSGPLSTGRKEPGPSVGWLVGFSHLAERIAMPLLRAE